MILYDDEYQKLGTTEEVEIGDVVVYYAAHDSTHVGIVVDVGRHLTTTRSITVMSKWGGEGEYIHPINHVPDAYGQRLEFWTDRKLET